MMKSVKMTQCIFCGQIRDINDQLCDNYTVHGKGKGAIVNCYHSSCYFDEVRKRREQRKQLQEV